MFTPRIRVSSSLPTPCKDSRNLWLMTPPVTVWGRDIDGDDTVCISQNARESTNYFQKEPESQQTHSFSPAVVPEMLLHTMWSQTGEKVLKLDVVWLTKIGSLGWSVMCVNGQILSSATTLSKMFYIKLVAKSALKISLHFLTSLNVKLSDKINVCFISYGKSEECRKKKTIKGIN